MAVSLTLAQERLQLYMNAEAAVLLNQSYKIAGTELTRANLKDIRDGISYWSGQVSLAEVETSSSAAGGSSRVGNFGVGC
jgi:hypothetical protein